MKAVEYFHNLWPRHRLQPTAEGVYRVNQLYTQIPQELIDTWIENVLLANPESTDPHVCVAWAARCDFVSSIIKIRDRAANPQKYEQQQKMRVA